MEIPRVTGRVAALTVPALFAGAVALAALPAQAATMLYDFAWTGDPDAELGPALSSADDAFAVGVFEISGAPGAVVGPGDVVAFELTFGGGPIAPVTVSDADLSGFFFVGTVAADASGIAVRDLFVTRVGLGGAVEGFGCFADSGDCGPSGMVGDNILMSAGLQISFVYDSAADAQASLRMTARAAEVGAIPLPASLPLLLGAFGLLALGRCHAT